MPPEGGDLEVCDGRCEALDGRDGILPKDPRRVELFVHPVNHTRKCARFVLVEDPAELLKVNFVVAVVISFAEQRCKPLFGHFFSQL